jgi:PRTRC genetic system protein A
MTVMSHTILREPRLPAIDSACLFEYVLAANGVFVRVVKETMEFVFPALVTATPLRGLAPLEPSCGPYQENRLLPRTADLQEPPLLPQLVGYTVLWEGQELAPIDSARAFEYVLAQNGIFVRARREGLSALIPVALSPRPLPGLAPLRGAVALAYPPVPRSLVMRMLRLSWEAQDREGKPVERAYVLLWKKGAVPLLNGWHLETPPQSQGPVSVTIHESDPDSAYGEALWEVHSHHGMPAFFSETDTRDEQGKFRLFAVLGSIFTKPQVLVRVGIWGHFALLPAQQVMELPMALTDGFTLHAWDGDEGAGEVRQEGSDRQ